MGHSNKSFWANTYFLWAVALLVTLAAARYQKVTGPTYPVQGEVIVDSTHVTYTFLRSHGGAGDQPVELTIPDTSVTGVLRYRHYPTHEKWTEIPLKRQGHKLVASLPHQPPAGKLEYRILLNSKQGQVSVPPDEAVVTRFKGAVPAGVLIPHIFFMFLAMLFSTRAGLEALVNPEGNIRALTFWTIGLLFLGGLILGPIVQKFAFGAFWTGVPFGWDLTDNKTLIAFLAWLLALLFVLKKGAQARWWVLFASLVLIAVFLIPHSMHGSQLKYDETGKILSD